VPNIRQIQQNSVPLTIEWMGIALNFKYRPGLWNEDFTSAIQSGDEDRARDAFAGIIPWWDFTEDVDDPDNPGQTKEQMIPVTLDALNRLPGPMRGMVFRAITDDITASIENTEGNSAASPPTSSAVASLEPVPNGTSG
jgi:hypothetical protein